LQLHFNDSKAALDIPSRKSMPLVIGSGLWAAWPLGYAVLPTAPLLYATAELQARVTTSQSAELLVFASSKGVAVELAFRAVDAKKLTALNSAVKMTVEGDVVVLRHDGSASHGTFATLNDGGRSVDLVLLNLPLSEAAAAEQLYTVQLFGPQNKRVLGMQLPLNAPLAGRSDYLLLVDNDTLLVRAPALSVGGVAPSASFIMAPPLGAGQTLRYASGGKKGQSLTPTNDGAFDRYTVQMGSLALSQPGFQLMAQAGPPRAVPTQDGKVGGNGKAREPTMLEWGAAAKYAIKLAPTPVDGADLRIAIDFVGDSARLYFKGT